MTGTTSTDTGLSARASSRICSAPALDSTVSTRPVAANAHDAWRAEHRLRRVAVEHQLDAAEALAQIVERAGHHGAAAIDDRDPIGDLIDFGDLMRREEHGHLLARDVRDERLQDFFGHGGIESRGRLVEHQQLGAAAERQQQRELGAHAARERLHLAGRRQLERRR